MEASLHLPVPTTTEEIKKKTKKTPKVVYFCLWQHAGSAEHLSDITCLLPQKPESEMHSPIGPRHQKIPFITGTVRSFPINCPMSFCYYRPYSKFCYFVLYPVNKPKPLSPCQHAKHTSHDEASPAPAVSAGQCSAQIRTWSQEEPSKSLSCIFLVSSWAWRRDWTTTSATGLTVRPAFGSAGRAGTNELVSRFFSFPSFCFPSFILHGSRLPKFPF